MKSSDFLMASTSEIIPANIIQLFSGQAVFLDNSSCYELKNSSSFRHLNAAYITEFNSGLVLHVRDQKAASYTAYIDPFTQIQWEKIFELFASSTSKVNEAKYEILLGFINIENSLNFELIKQILSRLTKSLQIHLRDKFLVVNFTAIYQVVDKNQLDTANCANILINIAKGTFAICNPISPCYFPFILTPMDKGALNIRLFDFTNENPIVLIFNRNAPSCSADAFLSYCYRYSPAYLKALGSYRQGDSYDLHFIVNYFKQCLSKLLSSTDAAQQYFNENLTFYLRSATTLFTAIKIYPTIISTPTVSSSGKQAAKIPRLRSSGSDSPVQQMSKNPVVERNPPQVDITSTAQPISPFWKKGAKNSNEETALADVLQVDKPAAAMGNGIKVPT